MKELQNKAHKRLNILTGEYVLVSPHRNKRPWQGQLDEVESVKNKPYVSDCYLCPKNKRAGGKINPDYATTFVFENDFAALPNTNESFEINAGLLKASSESGICKVVCFSPDHSKSLAEMTITEIALVVDTWQKEFMAFSKNPIINHIQIFENKGGIMGCSNPHPHGQIWAQSSIPNEVIKKDKRQLKFYTDNNKSLLSTYLIQELTLKERIVYENEDFVILVPFWATWPFETMIIPKTHQKDITEMNAQQQINFSDSIQKITSAYNNIFKCSFPYSSGIHQAPTNSTDNKHWHWHMSFYPPLLRSSSIKKFMVGYEMFAMPQRDITAESAAKTIRSNF